MVLKADCCAEGYCCVNIYLCMGVIIKPGVTFVPGVKPLLTPVDFLCSAPRDFP